jgi:hypothetical protein
MEREREASREERALSFYSQASQCGSRGRRRRGEERERCGSAEHRAGDGKGDRKEEGTKRGVTGRAAHLEIGLHAGSCGE